MSKTREISIAILFALEGFETGLHSYDEAMMLISQYEKYNPVENPNFYSMCKELLTKMRDKDYED